MPSDDFEVKAACEAAMELGYEVAVKDGHGSARNIDMWGLPEGVELIRGWRSSPETMMGGLDGSFDAVLYIGYHSPEGMKYQSNGSYYRTRVVQLGKDQR